MFKIKVVREKEYKQVRCAKYAGTPKEYEGSTVGYLTVTNDIGKILFTCKTLENIGPSTDKAGQDRRIMPRTYKLEWTSTSVPLPSNANKTGLLLTCDDVLGSFRRRRILIHIGNYPQDTLGCLLLGNNEANGVIFGSADACGKFYNLIKEYGVENFELEIVEIV